MDRLADIHNIPGVYLLLGLDGEPLYAGQGTRLRTRLAGHFVRQSSNATADGLLDIYEVSQVAIWYAERVYTLFEGFDVIDEDRSQPLNILEAALLKRFQPRWNRARQAWSGDHPDLTLEGASRIVNIIESPAELSIRRLPMQRIETKLLHMLRAVRKARISGASRGVKRAMLLHAKELAKLCEQGPQHPKDREAPTLPMIPEE